MSKHTIAFGIISVVVIVFGVLFVSGIIVIR